MRRSLAAAAVVAAVLAPAGAFLARSAGAKPASPAGSIVAISSSPALYPSFNRHVTDYVVRCGKNGLRLRVKATQPGAIKLDGRRVPDARLDRRLRRRTGEAATIEAHRGGRDFAYHVRCLPLDFPSWTFRRSGAPQARWYLMTPESIVPRPSYVAIFDRNGVPVWWMHSNGSAINATLLPHDRIAWSVRKYEELSSQSRPFEVHALDGSRVGTIVAPDILSDWHELRPLPNGDFFILGSTRRDHVDLRPYGGPSDATVLDGVAEELTPTGRVVWSWSSRDHIPLSASSRWYFYIFKNSIRLPDGRRAYDLVHLNSVEPDGSKVVISSRHTDAVYGVDKATGRVEWKLGGTPTAASLHMADGTSSDRLFGGQHDVRVQPDGTLTVHDNRSLWDQAPRALRIRLELGRRQARVVEHVSAPKLRSAFMGSARLLPGGDWVVSWGSTPRADEIAPSGKRILQFNFGFFYGTYRAVPIMPGQLSAAALRAGMDAIARRERRKR